MTRIQRVNRVKIRDGIVDKSNYFVKALTLGNILEANIGCLNYKMIYRYIMWLIYEL